VINLGDLPFASGVPDAVSRGFSQAQQLYSPERISQAIDRMAVAITVAVQDQNPVLLSVVPGGLYLTGQLMGRLVMPLQIGYVDIDSGLESHDGTPAGWRNSSHPELRGRNVVLVADILNCASTLQALRDWLLAQNVASSRYAVMVDQPAANLSNASATADFIGVVGPDRPIFGCGADFCGYGRNLPALYAIAR
jgi:hypoxanthine phosphoribosyltransferase